MLDYFQISNMFSPEEVQIRTTLRQFLDSEVLPEIGRWWEDGVFPSHLIRDFGKLGILGSILPKKYGTPALSSISYGLTMYELERIDSALRSCASVQSSLVMHSIFAYGSKEQRDRYLPALAQGEQIGCFGLTEHQSGSDPSAMETRARISGDHYVINGAKMWITNGEIADIAIIWAKDEHDEILGFIVPTNSSGFTAYPIKRKLSMRASVTSELVLDNVKLPIKQLLPKAIGLSSALECLTQARYSVAWGVLGALEAVYEEALSFATKRSTFGRPIASRQLIQKQLVDMLSDHTRGLLLAWRLGKLKDEDKLTYPHASLAKRENTRAALNAARASRQILAASGITLDHVTIRHLLNLESVDTYEGTHDIHTLLVGRDITGLQAFE